MSKHYGHHNHYKKLHIPDHWEHYWSKYPNGYTLLEALISWTSQVNDMIVSYNHMSDDMVALDRNFRALEKELRASWEGYKDHTEKTYTDFREEILTIVNNWISTIEPTIQDTVVSSLSGWLADGTLADIINNDVFDMKANQTDLDAVSTQVAQIESELTGRGVSLKAFGAVGNANFYNSKTDKWYENGSYTGNLGQEYNPEAYFNPHNKNYYQSATFSIEATDNTQVLQDALDYIANSNSTKTLIIDTGNFLINETIYFDYSNITVTGYGENSQLIAGNNITKALFYSDHGSRQNGLMQRLKITNITLFGNHKENYYGILFTGLDRGSVIEDNKIYGFGKDQIALISSWGFTINRNIFNGYYRVVDGERNYYGNGLTMGLDNLGVQYNVFSVNIPVVTNNTFQFLEIGLEYYYGAGGTIHGNNFENIDNYWMRINYVKGASVNGNYFEDLRVGNYGVMLGSNNAGDPAIAIDFTGNKFMSRSRSMQDIFIRNLSESVIQANAHDTRPDELGNDIYFSAQITLAVMYGNDINVRRGNVGALSTAIQGNNNIKQMGSAD